MRGRDIVIAGQALVMFGTHIPITWLFYQVLVHGRVTIVEPDLNILRAELGLSLLYLAGCLAIMIFALREAKIDHRRL